MLPRSCLLLVLGVLAPSEAGRVMKKRTGIEASVVETDSLSSVNTTDEVLAQVENNNLHDNLSNPNDVLSKLNIEPNDLLAGVISAVGDFDFGEPIGPQIGQLAFGTFLSAVGMLNPVLGAVFSVFAGLLGLNGADPNEALIKKILAQVDLMITKSLADFKNNLTDADIRGTLNLISKADTVGEWTDVCSAMHKDIFAVFTTTCWDNPDGRNCIVWQTKHGGGRALIYEIQYTELMISTYLELRRLADEDPQAENRASYQDKAEDLVKDIKIAGERVAKHSGHWRNYRTNPAHFTTGTVLEAGVGYNVLQGKDTLQHSGNQKDKDSKNDEYTGRNCLMTVRNHRRRAWYPPGTRITYQQWGRRRNPQNTLKSTLNKCRNDWVYSVKSEVQKLVDQASACVKVSRALPR